LGTIQLLDFFSPLPVSRPLHTIRAPRGPAPYSYSIGREGPQLPEVTIGKKTTLSLTRNTAACSVCGNLFRTLSQHWIGNFTMNVSDA
jgi:hypothetical protein